MKADEEVSVDSGQDIFILVNYSFDFFKSCGKIVIAPGGASSFNVISQAVNATNKTKKTTKESKILVKNFSFIDKIYTITEKINITK